MKNKLLVIALCATAFIGGCKNSSGQTNNTEDYRTAMQKKYSTESACRQDFPTSGDCVRQTTSSGGSFFMSPLFYPWGAVYHNNGMMEYNRRVPTSGFSAAPRNLQAVAASKTNFSRAPAARSSSTTRGGFGTTGVRSASSSRSSGG